MIAVLGILLQLAAPGTAAFPESQMARAMRFASDSSFLRDHPDLSFRSGKYVWSIRTRNGASTYTVTDGRRALSAPVKWAFGAGVVAQTYIAERAGDLYELPISFYPSIANADWTLGHDALPHATLEEAFGRKIDAEERRRCFGCHATNTVSMKAAPPQSLIPGIQCGRCHDKMPKLSTLDTEQLGEVCARCHPSWAEVASNGPHNVLNVRMQLYRLTNSRCYDSTDRRISCTACHNPHEPLVTDLSYYDGKCQACHSGAGKTCAVSKTGCIACHMPKIQIAGLHYSFTDHQIRIASPDGRYPE